jgi:hypothetical protein
VREYHLGVVSPLLRKDSENDFLVAFLIGVSWLIEVEGQVKVDFLIV